MEGGKQPPKLICVHGAGKSSKYDWVELENAPLRVSWKMLTGCRLELEQALLTRRLGAGTCSKEKVELGHAPLCGRLFSKHRQEVAG